jgi:hypothetical protein
MRNVEMGCWTRERRVEIVRQIQDLVSQYVEMGNVKWGSQMLIVQQIVRQLLRHVETGLWMQGRTVLLVLWMLSLVFLWMLVVMIVVE